jgi:transposase
VHKETLVVSVARPGREAAQMWGEIANRPKAVAKLVDRLNREFGAEVLLFCYEAGPCGYGLYRQLLALGHDCQVVAPSLIPKKAGERIKTDRRDALKLAQLLRSGDLTAVWVPDEEQEAMRDLTRARDDLKAQERKARQQLNAYVLRHGHAWPSGKTRWTQTHYNWLESLKFAHTPRKLNSEEATGVLSQGMAKPVWRTLVRAKPALTKGIIPKGRSRSMNPATRERPAPRCSEVPSVTNPRISA